VEEKIPLASGRSEFSNFLLSVLIPGRLEQVNYQGIPLGGKPVRIKHLNLRCRIGGRAEIQHK